jgi:hypothetical protein
MSWTWLLWGLIGLAVLVGWVAYRLSSLRQLVHTAISELDQRLTALELSHSGPHSHEAAISLTVSQEEKENASRRDVADFYKVVAEEIRAMPTDDGHIPLTVAYEMSRAMEQGPREFFGWVRDWKAKRASGSGAPSAGQKKDV